MPWTQTNALFCRLHGHESLGCGIFDRKAKQMWNGLCPLLSSNILWVIVRMSCLSCPSRIPGTPSYFFKIKVGNRSSFGFSAAAASAGLLLLFLLPARELNYWELWLEFQKLQTLNPVVICHHFTFDFQFTVDLRHGSSFSDWISTSQPICSCQHESNERTT